MDSYNEFDSEKGPAHQDEYTEVKVTEIEAGVYHIGFTHKKTLEQEIDEIDQRIKEVRQKLDDAFDGKDVMSYITTDKHDNLDNEYTELLIKKGKLEANYEELEKTYKEKQKIRDYDPQKDDCLPQLKPYHEDILEQAVKELKPKRKRIKKIVKKADTAYTEKEEDIPVWDVVPYTEKKKVKKIKKKAKKKVYRKLRVVKKPVLEEIINESDMNLIPTETYMDYMQANKKSESKIKHFGKKIYDNTVGRFLRWIK